jgi:hypothetical protein
MRDPGRGGGGLSVTGARYRLVPGDRPAVEVGHADVRVGDGVMVLSPDGGDVLRVPFGLITAAGAADGFAIRIELAGGTVIELTQLGRMRTQLLAELSAEVRGAQEQQVAAVGDGEIFTAWDTDGPAEARVYDDALVVAGPAGVERIGFSFIGDVSVADYTVRVTVPVRPPLVLSRLGRRTSELAGLLTARRAEARGRTAALLAALLPGFDPDTLRAVAGELRDGVAVPAAELDRIASGTTAALLKLVVLPTRRDEIAELGRRMELAIGFRQIRSVRREAVGATEWRDAAVSPHLGDHGSWGGGLGWGYGGFFGGNPDWWRAMTPRADVRRGELVPATEELGALTTGGAQPTVIAFVLGWVAGRVVFDVISQPGAGTWVFRATGPEELAVINRELDDAGFQPPGTGPLAARLVGQVTPGPDWVARLGVLLDGPTGAVAG